MPLIEIVEGEETSAETVAATLTFAQAIRFFDQHWSRTNGQIKFYPANAIEMYWSCTNSTDYLSGLMTGIPRSGSAGTRRSS